MSRSSIQSKVLLGFAVLTFITITLVSYIIVIAEQSVEITQSKALTSSLNESLRSINRGTENYLVNAARDYESYFRDLDVYYKVLISDLDSVTQKIEALEKVDNSISSLNDGFGFTAGHTQIMKIVESILLAQKGWKIFSSNLEQQFGKNKKEPRLEWGAKYIQDNIPALITDFEQIESQIDRLAQKQTSASKILGRLTIFMVALFTLLFAFWFYIKVVRSLMDTQKAFQRVADGEFGHQIEVKQLDEIGRLTQAFNSMSARSQLVLTIIDHLQRSKSDAELIENLHEQASSYFSGDAMILAEFNANYDEVLFTAVAPERYLKNIRGLRMNGLDKDQYFAKKLAEDSVISIEKLDDVSHSLMIKEIIKRYPLKSALVVPLKSDNSNRLLMFASYHESHFSRAQVELLTQLKTILSHRFD